MSDTTTKVREYDLRIEQVDHYEFDVRFDKPTMPTLRTDEGPPLGHDRGPDPSRLLAAAIGNCLAASLLFCLERAKHKVLGLAADVHVEIVRNEHRRLRIGHVDVVLHPSLEPGAPPIDDCLAAFEDFCTVTQSVRGGLDVRVRVEPTA